MTLLKDFSELINKGKIFIPSRKTEESRIDKTKMILQVFTMKRSIKLRKTEKQI